MAWNGQSEFNASDERISIYQVLLQQTLFSTDDLAFGKETIKQIQEKAIEHFEKQLAIMQYSPSSSDSSVPKLFKSCYRQQFDRLQMYKNET